MQSLSSLRSALGSISASFPLRSHGPLNSICRHAASPGKLKLSLSLLSLFPTSNWKLVHHAGCLESLGGSFWSVDNVARGESARHMSRYSGNSGMNFGLLAYKEDVTAPYALSFRSFIHSSGQKDVETGRDSNPTDFAVGQEAFEMGRSSWQNSNFQMGRNFRHMDSAGGRNSRPMQFVRGVLEQDDYPLPRHQLELSDDFVSMKLTRNNTFVTVTDSKGNKKKNVSMTAGWLQKLQGGAKLGRYAAEATAEHVGQAARQQGLTSFVMRVNGLMYFRRKRIAIMSFAEGYGKHGPSPITHIEDTTRLPHNGCRLPRKRRI
ncbi:unnamed protein product [Dovyalis caffra]|uniref:Ribosomal protein S11 n=1 Tax=Dovyalis caffra TaxID=77055 RepID=A0AAV1SQX7_9ROSI|nr:unnamed protein product [Dovyalis caffra]